MEEWRMYENNQVSLIGRMLSPGGYSYTSHGIPFYQMYMAVERRSSVVDQIPLMLPIWMFQIWKDYNGQLLLVNGQFRSYDKDRHKSLYVFVKAIEIVELETDPTRSTNNQVFLDGYICKDPIYRKTPQGREIADLIVAVDRQYNNSDYIPCICWGKVAREASSFRIGSHIQLEGRIQSREYRKVLGEGEAEIRIAYEVSVKRLRHMEERVTETGQNQI